MVAKVTGKIDVDLILEPGKIVGQDAVRNALVKAARGIDLPKLKLSQDIDLADSIPQITKKIKGVLREVNQAIAGELSASQSGFANLNPDQLQQVEKGYRRLNTLAREGKKFNQQQFKGEDFEKALRLFDQGYVSDGKGGKRRLTSATAGSFSDITGKNGKPLFTPAMLTSLERYTSQLKKFSIAANEAAKAVSKIESIDPLGNKTKAGLGAQSKRSNTDLEVLAERAKRDASAMQSRFVSNEQALKDQQALAKRNVIDSNKIALDARRRRAEQKRVDKVDAEYEGRRSKNISAGRGVGSLARFGRGEVLNVREYQDALELLGRKSVKAGKQLDALHQTDPKGLTKKTQDATQKVSLLAIEAKKATAAMNALFKPAPKGFVGPLRPGADGSGPFLPIGGTGSRKGQPYSLPTNAEIVGQRAFLASGAHGASTSIPKEELGAAAAFHRSRIKSLTAEQAKLNVSTAAGTKQFDKLGKSLFLHGRDLENVQKRMQSFGGATQQTSALFRQFFRYAIGYGALYQALAAVRALTAGVIDLDAALNNIKAVTQATNAEMRKISSGIKSVALETQFNTKDISDAAVILGQAGVIPQELPAALRATALFASATGSSIQLSADLITSLRNVFTDMNDSSIANLMTQAINISKLTAGDLKTVVSLSGQIAKSFNLTADKYFAAVSTLRNAGLKPSTVATGLRQGLLEVFSPDTKTLKALSARYKEIGEELSTDAIRDKFFGFSLTDSPLVTALRELQRLGFTGAGKKTFARAYDVRAENAISALINNITELEGASAKLTFGEAALVAAQTQMESLTHSLSNLGAAISVFASDVGQPLVDMFEGMTDGATEFVRKLTDLNTQLQITKGYGIEVVGAAGLAAGLLGAILSPGGLPGKAIVGAGFAAAGSNLALGQTGVQEAEDPSIVKGTFEKIWDTFGDVAQSVLLILGPVLGLELINKMRGKGSPLIDKLAGKIGLGKGAAVAAGGSAAAYGIITGRAGVAAAATATAGAATAGAGLGILGKVFASPAWLVIKTWGGRLLQLLRVNPILNAALTMYAAITGFVAISDQVGKAESSNAKKYKAALKKRDRTADNYQKLLESQAEFTLGAFGQKAAKGTTAESIDKLQEDLNVYQALANQYFGKEQDRVEGLTQKIIDVNKIAPEEGTPARVQRLDEIIQLDEVSEDLTPAILNKLANDASSFTSRGEALRGAVATYLTNLSEKTDLSGSSLAFKQAYDKIVVNDSKIEALLYGFSTGRTPEESTQDIIDVVTRLVDEQRRIFSGLDETQRVKKEEIEGRAASITALIEQIRTSPDSAALTTTLRDYGASFAGLATGTIEALNKAIEEMDYQLAVIQGKLRAPEELKKRRTELQTRRDEITFGPGEFAYRGKDQGEILSLDAEIRDIDKQLRVLQVKRKGLLEQEEAAKEGSDYLSGLKVDKVAAKTVDSEVAAQKFRTEVVTAAEFAPGADTDQRRALERTGADLSRLNELLLMSEEQLDAVLEVDKEGNLPNWVSEYTDGLALVAKMRKLLRDEDAEFDAAFHQDIEAYKGINEAETAIKNAKKAKNYTLLATSDEAENLYKKLERLTIADLNAQIAFVKANPSTGKKGEETDAKKTYTLTKKIEEAKQASLEGIYSAEVDLAQGALKAYKEATRREIDGYKKQRAIALDSGDPAEVHRLDSEIIRIKNEILALEIKNLIAAKATGDQILNHVEASKQDMLRLLNVPATARTLGTRQRDLRAINTPLDPRLSEDDETQGYLKQQGIVSSREQRTGARNDRIAALEVDIAETRQAIVDASADGPANPATIETYEQTIRSLNEEIGALKAQSDNESGFVGTSTDQLKKGFNLENVSNQLDTSASSISNLGNVIQDDIVGGLDDVAGGFANALASGESFTDGLKSGFSDMFRQIAADMIKSGVMSFFSAVAGSAAASFFAASSGGPVEAKAVGGMIGGGVITGPGTGTSDSIGGVVKNSRGQVTRGIAVSDGEGIVTAKAMGGLGVGFLNSINEASSSTLMAIRKGFSASGYRAGGVPSPIGNARAAAMGARMVFASPVMGYAGGGVIKDAAGMSKAMKVGGSGSTVEHNVQTNVNIEAGDDTGMTVDDLRRLDDGINLKVQEYIEEQMRPGGVLQASRGR